MEKDIWILYRGTRYKRIQEDYLISEDEMQVMFNGYIYRWNASKYYMGGSGRIDDGTAFSGKGCFTTLQRHIWEKYKGPIPKGYVVHHKDGNPKNNDISNLEILTRHEHGHIHSTRPDSWSQSKECSEMLLSFNEKAKEWHRSKEGREWHKNHAKNSLPAVKKIRYPKICAVCKKEYSATQAWQKYCSNKCKTRFRVLSRKDFEKRICQICCKEFECDKYAIKKTCSKECRIQSSRYTKRGIRFNNRT